MTDEKKAEEYVKTNHSHIMSGTMKSIYKKIYLAGLAEARKEYSEIPCTSCCITESLESDLSDLSANVKQLEKENAELKKQIEKMKICASSWIMSLEDVRASKVNDRRGEVLRELEKRVNECNKWELAE